MNFSAEGIALLVGGVGLLLTGVGLFYAARQLKLSRAIARAESYLHLDELLLHHKDVYLKLYPDPKGIWGDRSTAPSTVEEWGQVVMYMGLFERIKVLVDLGVIDLHVIKRLYAYRLQDIVNNEPIYQKKCVEQAKYWGDFIELCKALDIKPEKPWEGLGAPQRRERTPPNPGLPADS